MPPIVGTAAATNPRGGAAIAVPTVAVAGVAIDGRGHSVKRDSVSTTNTMRNIMMNNTMTTTANAKEDPDPIVTDKEATTTTTLLRTALNHLEAPRAHAIPMESMTIITTGMAQAANPAVET